MRMGIDESRSDEPPSKIDFLLPGRCASGALITANEADRWAVDHDSSCPWVSRGVHTAPDEDHDSGPGSGAWLDLRAVLVGNGENRRGVCRHFSRGSDSAQSRFQMSHGRSLNLQQVVGLPRHRVARNDLFDVLQTVRCIVWLARIKGL